MSRIFYLSKPDNLPYYQAGKELHVVRDDIGWVEFLTQVMDLDIFWIEGISEQTFSQIKNVALGHCARYFHSQDFVSLGLLKNLVDHKKENNFDLPLFARLSEGSIQVTCGLSRLFALAACQTKAKDIKFFLQTTKKSKFNNVINQQVVSTTKQAEQLSGIEKINHILTLDPAPPHYVLSSVIRESIYNKNTEEQYIFADQGRSTMDFWSKFISDGRINIDIHCNESELPLIRFNSNIWRVNYHVKDMGIFLYADILDKFHRQEDDKLHLNVYNITEPLEFEYMLPLVNKNNSWYHTQNKKVHLYETTQTSNGSEQPIVPWPNFVK